MTEISPQPGFYPDPTGKPNMLRYWNGSAWEDKFQSIDNPNCGPVNVNVTVDMQGAAVRGSRVLSEHDKNLRLIAFIFMLLSTIGFGFLLIPLAWCIPMTVHCYGLYKGTKTNTVAFGVCSLIFVSLVAGILLLCSEKEG